MVTLKFIKEDKQGRHVETTLTCATVDVIHCSDGGFIVTAYKSYTHIDGVEYHLSVDMENQRAYRTLFVMNEMGKTVDKYIAFKLDETVTK